MFELLQMNPNQFLRGWLFTDWNNNPTIKRFFKYEIIKPKTRAISDLGGNLWVKDSDMVIQSDYQIEWKVDCRVQLQDDKIYTISNVTVDPTQVAPQCLRYLKINPRTSYIISLKEYINGIDNAY